MPETRRYVLGFRFSSDLSEVVLIRKARPPWQAGKLNGVGGKVETTDERGYPRLAMEREFTEETGLLVPRNLWVPFADIGPDHGEWLVHCFASDVGGPFPQTMTDEHPAVYPVDDVMAGNHLCLSNVPWLLAMARERLLLPDSDLRTCFHRVREGFGNWEGA